MYQNIINRDWKNDIINIKDLEATMIKDKRYAIRRRYEQSHSIEL